MRLRRRPYDVYRVYAEDELPDADVRGEVADVGAPDTCAAPPAAATMGAVPQEAAPAIAVRARRLPRLAAVAALSAGVAILAALIATSGHVERARHPTVKTSTAGASAFSRTASSPANPSGARIARAVYAARGIDTSVHAGDARGRRTPSAALAVAARTRTVAVQLSAAAARRPAAAVRAPTSAAVATHADADGWPSVPAAVAEFDFER